MELPDFMSYANKFSQSEFTEKIARIAKRAGAKLVYAALILYYTLQSDKVSKTDKAIIIGALGYMISPLDVIPDAIPIAGLTDDLAVLLYVLKKVWTGIDPDIVEQAKSKLSRWFDVDDYEARIYSVESDFIYNYNSNTYQYKGYRFYLLLKYDITRHWNIGVKYSYTAYLDRDHFGSGYELIDASHRQQWRIQMRLKW